MTKSRRNPHLIRYSWIPYDKHFQQQTGCLHPGIRMMRKYLSNVIYIPHILQPRETFHIRTPKGIAWLIKQSHYIAYDNVVGQRFVYATVQSETYIWVNIKEFIDMTWDDYLFMQNGESVDMANQPVPTRIKLRKHIK